MNRSRASATCAALALASCTLSTACTTDSLPPLEADLAAAGWRAQPVIQGTESVVGGISPSSCQTLHDLLDQPETEQALEVAGFQHDGGAYLLLKRWLSTTDLAHELDAAATRCPQMTMRYDAAVLKWSIDPWPDRRERVTALALAAVDDSEARVVDMIVAGGSDGGTSWIVRVLAGPTGLGTTETDVVELVAQHLVTP